MSEPYPLSSLWRMVIEHTQDIAAYMKIPQSHDYGVLRLGVYRLAATFFNQVLLIVDVAARAVHSLAQCARPPATRPVAGAAEEPRATLFPGTGANFDARLSSASGLVPCAAGEGMVLQPCSYREGLPCEWFFDGSGAYERDEPKSQGELFCGDVTANPFYSLFTELPPTQREALYDDVSFERELLGELGPADGPPLSPQSSYEQQRQGGARCGYDYASQRSVVYYANQSQSQNPDQSHNQLDEYHPLQNQLTPDSGTFFDAPRGAESGAVLKDYVADPIYDSCLTPPYGMVDMSSVPMPANVAASKLHSPQPRRQSLSSVSSGSLTGDLACDIHHPQPQHQLQLQLQHQLQLQRALPHPHQHAPQHVPPHTQQPQSQLHARPDSTRLPHVCPYCAAEFRVKGYLTRHIKKHAIKKAYTCPFFGADSKHRCHSSGGFSRRDTYKTHLKSRHFIYPVGTSCRARSSTPGRCAGCSAEFDRNEDWIEKHICTGQCPAIQRISPSASL